MSGRARLPAGEPRKASQRNTRRAPTTLRTTPSWHAGDKVKWQGRDGIFRRDVGYGDHAEIVIGPRVYRVRAKELA